MTEGEGWTGELVREVGVCCLKRGVVLLVKLGHGRTELMQHQRPPTMHHFFDF